MRCCLRTAVLGALPASVEESGSSLFSSLFDLCSALLSVLLARCHLNVTINTSLCNDLRDVVSLCRFPPVAVRRNGLPAILNFDLVDAQSLIERLNKNCYIFEGSIAREHVRKLSPPPTVGSRLSQVADIRERSMLRPHPSNWNETTPEAEACSYAFTFCFLLITLPFYHELL